MNARILIADDEELERRALRRILSSLRGWEFQIDEAANGREAIEIALRSTIDLALLDVRMPGMDGLAAAHELRKLQPSIRLVYVTAFDSFDYAREALRLGVDEYLLKPADPDSVREAVTRALDLGRAEREDRERRTKEGSDGERALELLELELRDSLSRGGVDGFRLDSYFSLKGLGDGHRLALVIRPGGAARRDAAARGAGSRRLAKLAESILRETGWYAVGGFDEAEARLAAAAPKDSEISRNERIRSTLDRIVAGAYQELGLRVCLGASPYFPTDGPQLFSAAQDAASLARLDKPVAFLVPERNELEEGRNCGERCGGPIVDRAVALMRSRLAEDLSLADVAAAVGCSPFHLSRLFRLHAGDTFVRVFTRLRVEAAKALLRSGLYSVKQACALVGFHDQAYFARVFRKIEGISPSEFRVEGDGAK